MEVSGNGSFARVDRHFAPLVDRRQRQIGNDEGDKEMSDKKTIAVLGASSDHAKFGNKCVRAYVQAGWDVYPVNPKGGEFEGLAAYVRLADVPVALDRISVYLPPVITMATIPEMVEKGAGEVWLNPGSADHRVVDAARTAGLHVVDACSIVALGLTPAQFP
jgi:predicted CoA-binding protein